MSEDEFLRSAVEDMVRRWEIRELNTKMDEFTEQVAEKHPESVSEACTGWDVIEIENPDHFYCGLEEIAAYQKCFRNFRKVCTKRPALRQDNRPHQFVKYLSKKHGVTVLSINDRWKEKKY